MAKDKDPTPEEIQARNAQRAREVNEARNKARVDRLSEIADNNDAVHAGEMVDTPSGDPELDTPEAREARAQEETQAAERALAEAQAKVLEETPAAEAAEPETPPAEPVPRETEEPKDVKVVNGVTHYLTVVNGNEKWLTLDQLRAVAQKVESADEYLAAAAESVKKATRLDLSPKGDEPSTVEEVDWEKVARSVSMGDEEAIKTFASALKRIEARPKPSEVTPDAWQQIDDRLAFRRAVDWFEDEYTDVLGDAKLKKLVYERDAELAKEPQQGSGYTYYKQRLKKAGDEIRGWLKGKAPPATTSVTGSASQTKEAAKRALPAVPSAAARQPAPADEEEAEESLEEVIQKMALARGQPRAIVHRRGQR